MHAATYFSDTLTGGSLSANFTQAAANSTSISDISYTGSGASFGFSTNNGDGARNYIRTAAADYNIADFTASVTVTIAPTSNGGAVFMGLGSGDIGQFNEPGGSQYLRVRLTNTEGVGNGPFNLTDIGEGVNSNSSTSTTFRMLITYTALTNALVFGVDSNNDGVADLSSGSVSASGLSNDRIFFGGSGSDTAPVFTNFSVQTSAIPEPSTYALMFGGAALAFVAYRRSRAQRK